MNNTIEKVSQILEDTQTKLQQFAANAPYYEYEGHVDYPKDCLLGVLTEWSRQLLETCRELQTTSHPHEKCREIIGCDNTLDEISVIDNPCGEERTITPQLSLEIDNLRTALEVANSQIKEEASNILSLKERLEDQAKPVYQVIEDHEKELQTLTDLYSNVNTDLSNDINQTKSTLVELRTRYTSLILTLKTQLGETGKEVGALQERTDLSRPDDGAPSNPQEDDKINETALQGILLRQDTNLSKLDDWATLYQVKQSKQKEMEIQEDLQKSEELPNPHNSVPSKPENDGNNTEMEIQGLRGQLDVESCAYEMDKLKLSSSIKELTKELLDQQCRIMELTTKNEDLDLEILGLRSQLDQETDAHQMEKLNFTRSVNELVKELQDQQGGITELARINEDLADFAQAKDIKIGKLQQNANILEHLLAEKSKEVSKLSKEIKASRRVVSLNRKHCKKLRYNLEQCKNDLSRYIVESMTAEDNDDQ